MRRRYLDVSLGTSVSIPLLSVDRLMMVSDFGFPVLSLLRVLAGMPRRPAIFFKKNGAVMRGMTDVWCVPHQKGKPKLPYVEARVRDGVVEKVRVDFNPNRPGTSEVAALVIALAPPHTWHVTQIHIAADFPDIDRAGIWLRARDRYGRWRTEGEMFDDRRGRPPNTLSGAYVGHRRAQLVFYTHAHWDGEAGAEGPTRVEARIKPRRLHLADLPRLSNPFVTATLVYWEAGIDPIVDAALAPSPQFRERGLGGAVIKLARQRDDEGRPLIHRLRAPGYMRPIHPSLVFTVVGERILEELVRRLIGPAEGHT